MVWSGVMASCAVAGCQDTSASPGVDGVITVVGVLVSVAVVTVLVLLARRGMRGR